MVPVVKNLPPLIEYLLEERGQAPSVPRDIDEGWSLYRTLMNLRPPAPVTREFVALQDEFLQSIIEYRGIAQAADTPVVGDGDHIRLWRGDITTIAADAIVNAANAQMLGCFVPGHHCIDNAIHTFAGVQLRLECSLLMTKQGAPEPTGRAKVTEAFNLPSRHIIHTVGPIVQGALTDADRELLASSYTACLDAAAELGCESIAFCCISTGEFGFPQDEAAAIAVKTVKSWLDEHNSKMIVVFDVFTDADEQIYRDLLS